MERLKGALGLQWTYVDAMNMKNKLVGRLLSAVRIIRTTETGPFTWPAVMPPSNQYIKPWSTEFFSPSAKIITSPLSETEPPLCATENNTVAAYEPNLPEFLLITPARIACWYSQISVIEKIANDRSLKNDDVVIVLEDDIDMERDIHARLKHLWNYLPKEWDIVYLGMRIPCACNSLVRLTENVGHCWSEESFYPALNPDDDTTFNGAVTRIHPSNTPACNHAYAVTRTGARRILVHLRYPPFAYSRAFDLAIRWLIQSNRVKSFSILPSIVVQRKNTNSDIMPGKGTDWVGHLVDGVLDGLDRHAPR
jgi:GR25 family glycosyltransferase involved in LPS biosynthesis